MKVFFAFVLLYYFFGVQYLLQHITWLSQSTVWIVNIIAVTAVALLYYHCKNNEKSWRQIQSFFQSLYDILYKWTVNYLFVLSLVLFVLAAVLQVFRPETAWFVWRFFAAWLLFLCIGRDAFRDAKIYFGRHLFLHKESVFWFSVAITFLSVYRMQSCLPRSAIIAIIIGFLVYVLIIKKANIVRKYSIRKLFPTRLYIVAIIITGWMLAAQWYNISPQDAYNYADDMIQSYRDRTNQAWDTITTPEDTEDIVQEQEETSDIVVIGLNDDEEASLSEEWERDQSWATTGDVDEQELVVDNPDEQVNFTQALEHLFNSYDVELSTATNTRFANITSTNPNYPLFKTAHEKRLLGANIDPNSFVRCDVYMVMQGIVAGWDVSWQGTVFDQYRAAAQANDAVNGCSRDGMLRMRNL